MDERRTQGIGRASTAIVLAVLLAAAGSAFARPVARGGAPARPLAHAARACSLAGRYRSLGPTYVERLSVSHTSCATGTSVIKHYDACRVSAGGAKGHCSSKVLGFKCSEKRSSSPVQFVASVSCKNGRKAVHFAYSENTA